MVMKTIPMLTRPGIPNVNGITYTKECWEEAIKNIDKIIIPVTDIDYSIFEFFKEFSPDHFMYIPPETMLGHVIGFNNNDVIVDVYNEKADIFDEYVSKGYKGFLRYIGDDMDKNKVIHKIKRIVAIDIEPGFTW